MEFEVDRDDLHRSRVLENAPRSLTDGEARVSIDAFALTSNNVTYAAFGDMLRYWDFFPASPTDPGTGNWGRVPVWGFADVVESTVSSLAVGQRLYGYWPMATELIVTPGRFNEGGFQDLAAHRQEMASAYNRYLFVDRDPLYDASRESQQMVLWPLFMTSFLIDDCIDDNAMFGAKTVVVSSASSKTAIGTAYLLAARPDARVIGLTSAGNADFVRSLGCYHDTVHYRDVDALDIEDAVYVDIAGNLDVRTAVHERFAESLQASLIVGSTHWDYKAEGAAPSKGPNPEFFFAPTQISKRHDDWGPQGLSDRVGEAWARYSYWTDTWIKIETSRGASAIESVFTTLLSGQVDPRVGYVLAP